LVRLLVHTAAAVVLGSCGTSDEQVRGGQVQPAQATPRPSPAPPDPPDGDGADDVDGLSDDDASDDVDGLSDDDAADESEGPTPRATSDDAEATQPGGAVYGCLGQTLDDCRPEAEVRERERQRGRLNSQAADFLSCWRECEQDPACQRECHPVDSEDPEN
jgi:hypothetical protein